MDTIIVLIGALLVSLIGPASGGSLALESARTIGSVLDAAPVEIFKDVGWRLRDDINLLASKIGDQLAGGGQLEAIANEEDGSKVLELIDIAERVQAECSEQLNSGRITKKRIDELKSIDRALSLFRPLYGAMNECHFGSFADIAKLLKATASAANEPPQLRPVDPVRAALMAALKRHREKCAREYHGRFLTSVGHQGGAMSLVAKLVDAQLLGNIFPGYERDPTIPLLAERTQLTVAARSGSLVDKVLLELDAVERTNAAKGNVHPQTPRAQLEAAIGRLILEPCKRFTESLQDIFLPAKLDLAALQDSNLSMISGNDDPNFMHAWHQFIVCSSIHYNGKTIGAALSEKIAERYPN